jgi:Transposase DNA-binding/Transposase Tn5 dimerisation domain/Transposase DDE domain
MKNEQLAGEKWIEYELSEISLGDKRLNWRLLDSAAKLAAKPSVSINQACDDWADTKATYRLFANEKTRAEQILAAHQQRTKERMAGHKYILAIQDSSYLDYSHHPRKSGMGPIGTSEQSLRGLVMHSVLATTTSGLPLGLLCQTIWSRDETVKQTTSTERRRVPIEEKESNKWLLALSETVKWQPEGTRLVTVGDSEADIFELFNHACDKKTDMLIRAAQNRAVCEPAVGLLWDVVEKQPMAGHLKVQVSKREESPAREATVAVRYTSLVLRPPQHLRQQMKPLSLYSVLVQEINPPADVRPLSWLLLTTVPISSLDDAVERIHWYCQRWQIEILHKILKSGCRIEQAQLASDTRLIPMIALFSIIAWRLFWSTFLARTDPQAPASTILAKHELDALYIFIHKHPIPDSLAPTVHQTLRWIAQLGGFLARKNDGEPGVTVVWRGWQRLSDISQAYLAFHPL